MRSARPQTAGSSRRNTNREVIKKNNNNANTGSNRPQTAHSSSSSSRRNYMNESQQIIMKQQQRPKSAYLIKTGTYGGGSGSARSQQMNQKFMDKSNDFNTQIMLDHWTDVEGRVGYVTEKRKTSPSKKNKNMLKVRLGNMPPPPGSNGPTMEFMRSRGMQPHESTITKSRSRNSKRRRRRKKNKNRGGGGGFSWTGVYNTKYSSDYSLEATMKNKYIYNPW